jgi:peptidoglycan/xylan/chitin deacetylase (PgdA/CDA1 family)
MVMGAENFSLMLDYLSRRFHFLTLSELLAGRLVNSRKPGCLLTFDDGWRDNYDHAYPVLRAMGIPALIFLTTGQLESRSSFWVERLRTRCANPEILQRTRRILQEHLGTNMQISRVEDVTEHLKRLPAERRNRILESLMDNIDIGNVCDTTLNWTQVREMAASGIEFGGHTVTHSLLTYENDDTISLELRSCKEKIEGVIGTKVLAFAYPNGDWDLRVREHVRKAGFACAFTTSRGWHAPEKDAYTIPRVLLHDANLVDSSNKFFGPALAFTLAASS